MRLLLLLFLATTACAEIITTDRRLTWQGNVGISGGIPDSSSMTVFTTVSAGASAATINTAISSCPSNQVVKLSAGTYSLSGDVEMGKDGVVLKGAGRDLTIVTFGFSSNERLHFRKTTSEAALSVDADLSVDAVKGATTLTLASVPSWVTVGELIGIDQINDGSFVTNTGTGGGNSYRDTLGNGARGMGQLNRVVAKNATTITVELPLFYGWQTAKTAQIFEPFVDLAGGSYSLKRAGLEDMTLTYLGSGNDSHGISLENGNECWVKNVAITNTYGGSAIMPFFCYRCEFRGNFIHSSHLYTGGQGYGITPWHVSTACLIEDNILFNLHNPLSPNLGGSGNVFAYNYIGAGQSVANQNPASSTHSVHTYMNLFEGNWMVDKLLADWTHGSGSHNTLYRCRSVGDNGTGDNRTCVSIEYYNRYWNVVGNILGKPGLQNKAISHSGSTAEGSTGSIYKLGGEVNINDDYSPGDVYSYTSGMFVLLHRNYDTVTGGILDESGVADTTLLTSLYLSAQSTNCIIPFNPTSPGTGTNTLSYTNIQAGHRFAYGTNFIPASGNQGVGQLKLTSRLRLHR